MLHSCLQNGKENISRGRGPENKKKTTGHSEYYACDILGRN
jgi:hypothetical protein